MNNEALSIIGRQIIRPDLFFAEPSNSAKMEKNRTVNPRRREQMRRVVFGSLGLRTRTGLTKLAKIQHICSGKRG
jgi:hypothetical protein